MTITGPAGSSLTNQALNKSQQHLFLYEYRRRRTPHHTRPAEFLTAGWRLHSQWRRRHRCRDLQHQADSLASAHRDWRVAKLGYAQCGTDAQLDRRQCLGPGGDCRLFVNQHRQRDQHRYHHHVVHLSDYGGSEDVHRPASVLNQLPANSATGTGLLEIASGNYSTTFSPTLKTGSGGTIPSFFGNFIGVGNTVTYQ